MIVNGKYVKYDEGRTATIQRDINAADGIHQSVKSNAKDPKKLSDWESGASLDFGFSAFGANETSADRIQKYGYYREMAQMEFIQRGLEIIADDSSMKNLDNNVLKVFSDNEKIRETLEELFVERLDLNTEFWSIIYETVKMGDNFYEIIPDSYEKPTKIVYIRHLKPENVERIEINGRLMYYTYTSTEDRNTDEFDVNRESTTENIYKLQPWQIVHFKVKDDKDDNPYGTSLLKPGIRTYRRLSLLEDIILVYRISRAPERRVFYIDVGNMNYTDSKKFMQKLKSQYRTQNFIDEQGNINRKSNVLSVTSDIFVPQKEGGTGTKIETLPGGDGLNEIKDLEYFKNKILRIMNIPPAYLGDDTDKSQGSLSQLDYRFSRFIERIQTQAIRGIEKIAAVELYFKGYKKEELSNFRIEPTASSNIAEITDIDLMNQRMSLISTIKETNLFDNEWILKNIMKFSNKEISDINLRLQMQKANEPEEEGMGAYGAGAYGSTPGMDAYDIEPGAEGPEGAEGIEGAGEEGATAPETEPTAAAPEESVQTKEEVITEALVSVLGKEFIIKESKDFFGMMKYLKEERHSDTIPIMERASEIIRAPVKKKKVNKTNGLKKAMLLGELSGLSYKGKNGKTTRVMKLYEAKDSNKEKVIILKG